MQNNRWLSTTGTSSSSRTSSIHEDQQQFFASKEECHLKSIKTFDDWEYVIKSLSKTSLVHDDTLKTAKLFTQVDSLSKNTKNSIEKTSKTLDQLLDK
jgi:predicted ABC-type exoprotein transport system permease subunit